MGKAKKRRRHNQGHHGPAKRQRRANQFWIEHCHDSFPKKGDPALTVIITQVDLTDDHIHVARKKAEEHAEEEEACKEEALEEPARKTEIGQVAEKNRDQSSLDELEGDKQDVEPAPLISDKPEESETAIFAGLESPGTAKTVQSPAPFISIRREPSANRPPPKFSDNAHDFQPLPHGDCGDGVLNPHADVADKYWAQRKRLFSKFDDGIQLDKEGWYSVTPEAIADHIASRVVDASGKKSGLVVLDGFCGCGGNAIAFARRPEVSLVVCVDLDRNKLMMAAKNAKIYKIPKEKILFIHDNVINILENLEKANAESSSTASDLEGYPLGGPLPQHVDFIFLSPPWGGMSYLSVGKSQYDIAHGVQLRGTDEDTVTNGEELLVQAVRVQKRIGYFLPRNINGISLGRSAVKAGYSGSIELEKNMLNDKFKTVTAYFGMMENDSKVQVQQDSGAAKDA